MKRTTVFADENTLLSLQTIARETGVSVAELIRRALGAFVLQYHSSKPPLSFVGIGRSGRPDVAERSEELLSQSTNTKEGFGH